MSTNDIFIGKRDSKEWKKLKKNVFNLTPEASGGGFYSVIGPNGIGKSFLINKLEEEFLEEEHPQVYIFRPKLSVAEEGVSSYWLFWFQLIREMAKKIRLDQVQVDDKLKNELRMRFQFFLSVNTLKGFDKEIIASAYLTEIFELLKELCIRIILIVEEFDRAKDIYDGTFFQYLFDISPKSSCAYKLSIILVSRRHVSTIAHGMDAGSSFESAFPEIKINGFNDKEMISYFDLYQGKLSDIDKENIYYFCGRSPAMLMAVYEEYDISDEVPDAYEMSYLLDDCVYRRLSELLKTEYADEQKEKSYMGIFIQAFLGPAYDENLGLFIARMYWAGYVLRKQRGYESIMGRFDTSWNSEFEPIAPYILEYIKKYKRSEYINGLSAKVSLLEDLVRKIIKASLMKNYGDAWKEHIDEYIGAGVKDSYYKPLSRIAEENNATERGIEISKLDVLGFMEYLKLIKAFWDKDLEEYFPDYKNREALNKDFELMKTLRDSYAHRTSKVLGPEVMSSAQKACDKLLNGIQAAEEKLV